MFLVWRELYQALKHVNKCAKICNINIPHLYSAFKSAFYCQQLPSSFLMAQKGQKSILSFFTSPKPVKSSEKTDLNGMRSPKSENSDVKNKKSPNVKKEVKKGKSPNVKKDTKKEKSPGVKKGVKKEKSPGVKKEKSSNVKKEVKNEKSLNGKKEANIDSPNEESPNKEGSPNKKESPNKEESPSKKESPKKKGSPDEEIKLSNGVQEIIGEKISNEVEVTKKIPIRKTARKQITPAKKLFKKEEKTCLKVETLAVNKCLSPSKKTEETLTSNIDKEDDISDNNEEEKVEKETIKKVDKKSKVGKKARKIVSDDEEDSDHNDKALKQASDEVSSKKEKKDNENKRKIDDLSNESSDEEVRTVKRKRKRNVITDDSPVKQVANIFQKTKDTYNSKLDNFIMKPKQDTTCDSTVLSDIVKKENEMEESEQSDKEIKSKKRKLTNEETPTKNKESSDSMGDEKMEVDDDLPKEKPTKKHPFFEKDKSKIDKKPSSSDTYCPSKNNYHPIDDACWKKDEKVPYLALAKTLEEIENISGRLKMIEILANFFRSVIVLSPDDLVKSIYLCLNRLAPEYHSVELGVGETLLMKAMGQATGRSVDKIKAEVAVKGDLGLVAESSRANQRVMFGFPKLTVSSVFTQFKEIAEMSGNAVMNKKISKMQALFSACRDCEAKYIIRSLGGKLRIGLAEQSILAALGQAVTLTPPNQEYPPKVINATRSMREKDAKELVDSQTLIIKTTYCECPDYDAIIPVLLKEGVSELPKHCHLTPGIPLKPMLAHPTNSIDEVLKRFDNNEFTCEFKYDGERAQIHRLEDGTIKIYSRNQEDNTSKYPDVIERFSKSLTPDTKSCILDSEIVAWDKEKEQIRPFQVLSTRKRKDAVSSEIQVQVCVVAFDLLFLNGEPLVTKPLIERRELLRKSFQSVANEFCFAQSMDGSTSEIMQQFLDESVIGNCEGLMVKSLKIDATYEIAKRSRNWLKLKKDYLEGAGDSLDLLVIGGWFGKGKRTGTYGGFLLACYDNDTEEFQTICKIGTGFSDSDLDTHTQFFKNHTIPKAHPDYRYENGLQPDQWFEPIQVWEVKCSDLSVSPVHKAACGLVDSEKGISLRFPRFICIREDKKPEDVTSAEEVANMYNRQKQIQNQNTKDDKGDVEDYY